MEIKTGGILHVRKGGEEEEGIETAASASTQEREEGRHVPAPPMMTKALYRTRQERWLEGAKGGGGGGW